MWALQSKTKKARYSYSKPGSYLNVYVCFYDVMNSGIFLEKSNNDPRLQILGIGELLILLFTEEKERPNWKEY